MNLLFLSPSGGELILVLLLVLLLFGSKRIPGLARSLGKGIREIKNATGDIKREINSNVTDEMKRDIRKIKETRESLDVTKSIRDDINDSLKG